MVGQRGWHGGDPPKVDVQPIPFFRILAAVSMAETAQSGKVKSVELNFTDPLMGRTYEEWGVEAYYLISISDVFLEGERLQMGSAEGR